MGSRIFYTYLPCADCLKLIVLQIWPAFAPRYPLLVKFNSRQRALRATINPESPQTAATRSKLPATFNRSLYLFLALVGLLGKRPELLWTCWRLARPHDGAFSPVSSASFGATTATSTFHYKNITVTDLETYCRYARIREWAVLQWARVHMTVEFIKLLFLYWVNSRSFSRARAVLTVIRRRFPTQIVLTR